MTGTLPQSLTQPTDADLVLASRKGDREAFGRIVRRYQAMITGLIYAACGDLQRSEEIAQDTFVSAWKSLSGLREPSKLPAWLCQVARHRLLDQSRSDARRTGKFTQALHDQQDESMPSPPQQLLNNEERELLWNTLREIAQPYRETLVLYYRQGKSVSDVALAMETTEANVRQRLTRGREMLREQVAAMLERNLVRSAPAPAFALAVTAALPAIVPSTAKAIAVGSTATGTAATAKGAGLIALLAMWFGPIFGIAGGAFGTWNSIRATKHPRERQFVVRMAIAVWMYVIAAMAILFGLTLAEHRYRWSGQTYGLLISGFWLAYVALLIAFVTVSNRRLGRLRQELGLPEPVTTARASSKGRWLGFAGASVGALGWMLGFSIQAHDAVGVVIVALAAAIAVGACRRFVPGRTSPALQRFATFHLLGIGLFTLVMVNWRFYQWLSATGGLTLTEAHERIPLWTMNLFTLVLIAVMLVTVRMSFGASSRNDP